MHALLFLAAIALTFVSSCAVENSTTAQQAMGATLCRTGWQLEFEGERSSSGARRPASGTSVGVLRVVTDNAAPFCVGPAGERDRCQSCILVMFSPFLLCVALFLGEFVWFVAHKPTASEHLRQLELARSLGAISPEQYEELRRRVIADPEMTQATWKAIKDEIGVKPKTPRPPGGRHEG